VEKIPFLVLSGLVVYSFCWAVEQPGRAVSQEFVPFELRLENALVSYVAYAAKMVWPRKLAVYYPYPDSLPVWQVLGALLLVGGVTAVVISASRRKAYLGVGWFWYMGTLVPVIGLYQAGLWPAMADRWAYVPLIGLFVMVSWGVGDIVSRRRWAEHAAALAGGVCVLALIVCTWVQVGHWRNTTTLFEHALDVTERNHVAHFCMIKDLLRQGKFDQVIHHSRQCLKIKPNHAQAHGSLAAALGRKGRFDLAVKSYKQAVKFKPDWVDVINNLAWILATHSDAGLRDPQEAVRYARQACKLTKYENPAVLDTLAAAYAAAGRFDEATAIAQKVLELAQSSKKTELMDGIQDRLRLYQAGRPYIEP
jgi:cytochrome c-type biogenesis protein CcmH/NrfG